MTLREKVQRAEAKAAERSAELVEMAAKHTRQGRWLVELHTAARKYVNAEHAVGRARKHLADAEKGGRS